jgi:hypothetical protein
MERPVAVTEAGVLAPPEVSWIPAREGIHDTPLEAAIALVRGDVELISAGATQVFAYYVGRDRGWFSTLANGAYVLTDNEGRPKATMIAFATLAALLGDAKPAEVSRSDGRVVHAFAGADGAIAVVWGTAAELAVPPSVTCFDLMGNASKPRLSKDEPLYCRASSMTAHDLLAILRRQ